MLKLFFVCLLFANGALFAYQQGYLDTLIPSGHEPSRAARQLNADKIKPLSNSAGDSSPTLAAGAPSVSASAAAPTLAASTPETVVAPIKKPELIACTEIGNFIETDAATFEKLLAPLTLAERVSRRKIEEISSRIVAIPSQGSKEAAEKKAGELRRFGITDFLVIKDEGSLQWGISLGVYKTQEAAQIRLANLNKKGVHSARISTYSTSSNKVAFQLRDLELNTKEAIVKIKSGFPQQEVRNCE